MFDFTVASYSDHTTRVSIELKPLGQGASELTLTHELGDSDDALMMEEVTRKGWAQMLQTLERELFPRRVGVQF